MYDKYNFIIIIKFCFFLQSIQNYPFFNLNINTILILKA